MSFLTHSDPSIKAAGDLAEDLKQCGQPVEIHYKNELNRKFQNIKEQIMLEVII